MLAEIGWHHFCVIPSPAKRESRDLGFGRLDKGPSASGDHFCVIPSAAKRESRDLGFRQLDKGPPASGDHFCVIPSAAKRSRGILGSGRTARESELRQGVTTSLSSRAQRSGVEGSWFSPAR